MKPRKILYFVVGVGAGNTTRTLAIHMALRELAPNVEVEFAVQGNALELLSKHFPVHRMRSATYSSGGGGLSPLSILTHNLSFPKKFMENRRRSRELMERLKPDLVVADSDFYCLGAAKHLGIPLASVNSSPATMALLRRHGTPAGCAFSANCIERIDEFLQDRYPDRVVAPVIRPVRGLAAKVKQVPVIVRPELMQGEPVPAGERRHVVVVTGGSGIGTADIDLRRVSAPMITYGTRLERVPPQCEQRGFDLGAIEAMRSARLLVVQGGFSSVSEAVALRIPTVVLPIARHAEQAMNGLELEKLGHGRSVAGADAGAAVEVVLASHGEYWEACQRTRLRHDGARLAARWLLDLIS